MIKLGLLRVVLLFMYLNGGAPVKPCELMQGEDLKGFYRDVIADTTLYEDGISAESRVRISKELVGWDSTDVQLGKGVVLNKKRDANTFSMFTYIYRPKIADTMFKAADRVSMKCQALKHRKDKLVFPEVEGVTLVRPETKEDADYYSYSYPLLSANKKYAVVKRMRPQSWIQTVQEYTYNMQVMYFKCVNGKWVCVYESGFWF